MHCYKTNACRLAKVRRKEMFDMKYGNHMEIDQIFFQTQNIQTHVETLSCVLKYYFHGL